MTNVFPVLSRLHADASVRFHEVRSIILRYLLALALPLAVGAFVAAEPLIRTVFGAEFGPAVTPMRILALTIPLASIHAVLWRVLSARAEQGVVFRVELVSMAAKIAAAFPLIMIAASTGAAVAAAAAFALHTALLAVFVKRDGTQLHLLRLSWPFAAGSLVMGAVAWLVLERTSLWIAIPAAAAFYGLVIRPFVVRPSALLERLRSQGLRVALRPRR